MKKEETAQNKTVKKPLILYFFIACMIMIAVVLLMSLVCYGMVQFHGEENYIFVEHIDELTPMDAAIVPGAGVYEDAPGSKAQDRLDVAIQLYEKGKVNQIIVTGDIDQVDVMVKYLQNHGVSYEKIACDNMGLDTYESITRIMQKYGDGSYYFCTQLLYVNRAKYIMNVAGMAGRTICVDTMVYNGDVNARVREYFAAAKAVYEGFFLKGQPKNSIEKQDFVTVRENVTKVDYDTANEVEVPEDFQIIDENPDDDYDVLKATEYARTYALEHNPEYPVYEQNCTNFVSQCIVAGGIKMRGESDVSESHCWKVSDRPSQWYCIFAESEEHEHRHYSASTTFINANEFIRYFSEELGYELTIYDNNYEGKLECYNDIASGDVYILYNDAGSVVHIGLITGVGNMNAYYCANSGDKKDYSAFNISDKLYPQIGILHMSSR